MFQITLYFTNLSNTDLFQAVAKLLDQQHTKSGIMAAEVNSVLPYFVLRAYAFTSKHWLQINIVKQLFDHIIPLNKFFLIINSRSLDKRVLT